MQNRFSEQHQMISIRDFVRKYSADEPQDPAEDEQEHEWAEYNLPPVLFRGLTGADDDDLLAFLGLGLEPDGTMPDGST